MYSSKHITTQYGGLTNEEVYLLFTEEKWPHLTSQKRLEALQEIECRMAARQNRTPCKVREKNLPVNNYGAFNGEEIVINSKLLRSSLSASLFGLSMDRRAINALDTVIHEGRHAFQRAAIVDSSIGKDLPKEVVRSWLVNTISYASSSKKPSDFFIYAFQPLERDAREYAGRALAEIYRAVKSVTGKRDNYFERGIAYKREEKINEYQHAKLIVGEKEIEERILAIKKQIVKMLAYKSIVKVPYMNQVTTLLECMDNCDMNGEVLADVLDQQIEDIQAIVLEKKEQCDYMDGLDDPDLILFRLDGANEFSVQSDLDSIVARIRELTVEDAAVGKIGVKLDGFKSGT